MIVACMQPHAIVPCFGSGWYTGNTQLWQLSNIVSLCMYQTPNPKGRGGGESGTVSYTVIYSPWKFRSMNLIGWVLLNSIVALHRWLSTEKCSDSDSGREHLDMRLPLIHTYFHFCCVANKYPLHKFCLLDMLQIHFGFKWRIPLTVGVWLMFIAKAQAEKQSVEPCKTLVMLTGLCAAHLWVFNTLLGS